MKKKSNPYKKLAKLWDRVRTYVFMEECMKKSTEKIFWNRVMRVYVHNRLRPLLDECVRLFKGVDPDNLLKTMYRSCKKH